ncbi:hypothetical protein FVA74_09445 [Salinibacterium sp. dk2585]|uniref:ATP-dependent zinc protease family protein n=1 Tax=unclassified Salinibacterium TaxID=2632331 RepID=UPI0011C24AAA|nr:MULTISPECIES: RimK/LysX family protein [unclassified Salinibacterium]QEE61770.1 hypothetical protein FVA74_09445 [Salinibacterium sp. dk2585]TXK54675.1 hypothetical protein FVP63_06515 [Salinibacterium sp. dk5596]
MGQDPHSITTVGWREWVSIPNSGVPWIKAKLDTGARTSSLHAFDIELIPGERERVRFSVHPWQRSARDAVEIECDVHDHRSVRSSSGHTTERIVVLMDISIHGRVVTAEVTLANRDSMGFRMLIGREALRQGFLVDSARSFLGGKAPREVRRANRGR